MISFLHYSLEKEQYCLSCPPKLLWSPWKQKINEHLRWWWWRVEWTGGGERKRTHRAWLSHPAWWASLHSGAGTKHHNLVKSCPTPPPHTHYHQIDVLYTSSHMFNTTQQLILTLPFMVLQQRKLCVQLMFNPLPSNLSRLSVPLMSMQLH